jgi:hypothetical protein
MIPKMLPPVKSPIKSNTNATNTYNKVKSPYEPNAFNTFMGNNASEGVETDLKLSNKVRNLSIENKHYLLLSLSNLENDVKGSKKSLANNDDHDDISISSMGNESKYGMTQTKSSNKDMTDCLVFIGKSMMSSGRDYNPTGVKKTYCFVLSCHPSYYVKKC